MRFDDRYLEDVLEGICNLLPFIHQVFVPLPHEEVQVLIFFPEDDTIMVYPFLLFNHCAPPVSMQSVE